MELIKEKIKLAVITAVIFISLIFLVRFTIDFFLFRNMPVTARTLIKFANEVNKRCPITIDSDTVLDNTMAGEGNQFIYNYSLVNKTKDQIENIEALEEKVRDNLINKFKSDDELFFFRKSKINIICNYRDKNRELFMKIDIKPDEYILPMK